MLSLIFSEVFILKIVIEEEVIVFSLFEGDTIEFIGILFDRFVY